MVSRRRLLLRWPSASAMRRHGSPTTRKPAPPARKPDGRSGGDDVPVAARRGRQDQARILRRAHRPRSEGRHHDQTAAAPRTGDAAIQPPQPPHVLRRRSAVEARIRVLHRRHRRADARQHPADARGVATEFRRPTISSSASPAAPVRAASKLSRPSAANPISLELAAELDEVSILGEKLTVLRADGQPATYAAPGRPIAIISDVTVEYTPAPHLCAPVRRH